MLRVVFDTNVWISAQISRGSSYRCLLLAHTGLIRLAHCSAMLAELSDKLQHIFDFDLNDIRGVMYDYRRVSDEFQVTGAVHVVSDPDDDMFLECALISDANVIVSQDKHLLKLGEYQQIPIWTPQQFLERFDALYQPIKNGEAE